MKCKGCNHEFILEHEYMVYCPCGKTFYDWVTGTKDKYRFGGDYDDR